MSRNDSPGHHDSLLGLKNRSVGRFLKIRFKVVDCSFTCSPGNEDMCGNGDKVPGIFNRGTQ